jgi:hypothetical protein
MTSNDDPVPIRAASDALLALPLRHLSGRGRVALVARRIRDPDLVAVVDDGRGAVREVVGEQRLLRHGPAAPARPCPHLLRGAPDVVVPRTSVAHCSPLGAMVVSSCGRRDSTGARRSRRTEQRVLHREVELGSPAQHILGQLDCK